MLKWLRKYNTFILVVGGCLLMVAFLLQSVLNDLGKRGFFGGTVFKVGSHKVTEDALRDSGRDYNAMAILVGGHQMFEATFGIESLDHWYLLEREAEQAGLVGGERDGESFLDELPQALAAFMAARDFRYSYDNYVLLEKMRMNMSTPQAMSQTGLTTEGFHKALARLRGISRLTSGYTLALHYGERRLASQGRELADMVRADYVIVPAERELAGVAEPDESAIKAHYEKYKDTPRGGGQYGIGYTLPARVKLAWLEINRQIIADSVEVNEIEAEKRFQRAYPNGQMTEGKNAADERKKIALQVRDEQTDKAITTAETAVRDEIFRATRKLEREGEFYRIPAGFELPDLSKIREVVAARLNDIYKMTVPAPKVVVRSSEWVTAADMSTLEGIGLSSIKRGQSTVRFVDALLSVKEIAGTNDFGLQVGIPSTEAFHVTDQTSGQVNNSYFFVVLDARKESPPDSMDEVKTDIVRNIKRLAAYEKLKARESELLQQGIAGGLDALMKPPAGVTDPAPIKMAEALFNRTRTDATDDSLDTPEFRTKAMAVASALDPMVDPTTVPADKRMFSYAADKSLGVAVLKIKALQPLTVERFRQQNASLVRRVRLDEFGKDVDNPYSLENLEKRLDVKYEEGRAKDRAERKAERDAQKAKSTKQ